MISNKQELFFKSTLAAFWISIIAYLFPFISQIFNFHVININNDNFLETICRSVLFSVLSSLVIVVFSYTAALSINKIRLESRLGKILSVSLMPVILGNVTTAYIFKSILADTQFFSNILKSDYLVNYSLLTLIQLWQFGFFFIYVFWLNHKAINKNKIEFAESHLIGFFNKLKDIFLPASKNLLILFSLICFINNFYEEAKAYHIFKFSQGTNTELINHWLFRNYQSELIINPTQANIKLLTYSLIVFFLVSCTAFLLLLTIKTIINLITVIRLTPPVQIESQNSYVNNSIFFLLLFLLLFPIIYCLTISVPSFTFGVGYLLFPFGLTLLTSLIATFLAIFISISFRQIFRRVFSSFNTKSLIFIILIFSLLLIPPIAVMLCGYKWYSQLLNFTPNLIILIWIIAHVVLLLPQLISFLIVTHFAITNNELRYLQVYSQTASETIRINYIKRFKGQYLLTFLFSFGVIWNEDIINKILSDFIPSFIIGLEMMISGKSADFSKAAGYLFISLFISVFCVLFWNYLFNKNSDARK